MSVAVVATAVGATPIGDPTSTFADAPVAGGGAALAELSPLAAALGLRAAGLLTPVNAAGLGLAVCTAVVAGVVAADVAGVVAALAIGAVATGTVGATGGALIVGSSTATVIVGGDTTLVESGLSISVSPMMLADVGS